MLSHGPPNTQLRWPNFQGFGAPCAYPPPEIPALNAPLLPGLGVASSQSPRSITPAAPSHARPRESRFLRFIMARKAEQVRDEPCCYHLPTGLLEDADESIENDCDIIERSELDDDDDGGWVIIPRPGEPAECSNDEDDWVDVHDDETDESDAEAWAEAKAQVDQIMDEPTKREKKQGNKKKMKKMLKLRPLLKMMGR